MRVGMYTVYDSAANAYLPPWACPSTAVAMRLIHVAVQNPEHDFHKFSTSYQLFHVGYFDNETGVIEGTAGLTNLGTVGSIAARVDAQIAAAASAASTLQGGIPAEEV